MKQLKNSLVLLGILVAVIAVILVVHRIKSGAGSSGDAVFRGFDPTAVTSLVIKGRKQPVTLVRAADGWIVASADSFPADTARLGTALGIIDGMETTTLVSQNPAKQVKFQVDTTAGVRVCAYAGDKAVADMYLGKNGPGYNGTYFRAAGSSDVYLYTAKSIKYDFSEDAERWKDTFVMKFDKDRLTSFTLAYPDRTLEIGKGADLAWRLLQPEDVPAKQQEVNRVINALASMGSKDMMRASGDMAYGVDRPLCAVSAVLDNGAVLKVDIGSEVPDSKEKVYYARRADRPGFVYTLRKYQYDTIAKHFEELKDDPPPAPDSSVSAE